MPRQIWKNKPDSKLALPQLSTLGAITSKEMKGSHLVAQHENGTAIIKNAVINPNAPLSSLHWGIQAYKDASGNKRLFCSTADGTYPVGWENIKYDDEAVNTVFYDVARNSTSNNIAGLITEDEDGKLKVYIGEGYENIKLKITSSDWYKITNDGTSITFEILKDVTPTVNYVALTTSVKCLEAYMSYDITENKDFIIANSGWGNRFTDNLLDRPTPIGFNSSKLIHTDGVSEWEWDLAVRLKGDTVYTKGSKVTIKNIQITKTSTQKPFTEGIVPNGSLKIVCDWNLNTHSFIYKNFQKSNVTTNDWHWFMQFNENSVFGDTKEVKTYWGSRNTDTHMNYVVSKIYKKVYVNNSTTLDVFTFASAYEPVTQLFFCSPYKTGRTGTFEKFLFYKGNLTQSQMEGELAKDIYLPSYHHQPNSVINTYGIQGMSDMFLYSPALSDDEIKEELEKNIELKEIGDITIGLETIKGALVYNGEVVEEDIAKDINPKPYHWQDNSIINKYKVKGFSRMYTYKPELTDAEIAEEVNKNVYLPKTHWNIPNHLGIVN